MWTVEGGRDRGALPGLTRRDLLAGAAASAVALAFPARATARFPRAEDFGAHVPAAWFDLMLDLVRDTPGFSPPVASRALGYAGVTLYEAVVPGMEGYRSLGTVLPALGPVPGARKHAGYDWEAVANAALASIVRVLIPGSRAAVRALEDSIAARLRTGSRARGIAARSARRGREVAAAIFEWSKTDGGHKGYESNHPPYTPPVGPGLWVPTPPGFLPALQPFWGRNRCLAVAWAGDHAPGDHPAYSEDAASAFFSEALEVYEAVNHLTREHEAIARFWSDDPGTTATPPGHSIAITTQVLRGTRSSLATAAEGYARVGIAVADAFACCWYQKYVYNLLRPVTYVNRLIDLNWQPLLVTPPFPEYTSGHSVQSGAAFQVLTDLFGDGYAFVDHTHDARGLPPRSFGSFLEAADEAAISRLYGGIHFRAAIVNGIAQGRGVGATVSALPLRR